MDYTEDKIQLGNLRKRFYDRRKELELLDDCIGEALTKRAVPVTISLSAATYIAIREGFLKDNGLFGMMRKNFICMCVGIGVSLIGIKSDYYDKLSIFYTSHRYQELRKMIIADWKQQRKSETDAANKFDQRLDFKGLDSFMATESNKNDKSTIQPNYVTYEELQRKNKEKYAIKHTVYY